MRQWTLAGAVCLGVAVFVGCSERSPSMPIEIDECGRAMIRVASPESEQSFDALANAVLDACDSPEAWTGMAWTVERLEEDPDELLKRVCDSASADREHPLCAE